MTTLTLSADRAPGAETKVQSFITRGVQKTVLPNGLTIIAKEMHDKPVVATVIWYRVGSRNEELGQTGKSHFLEHMLFKGTDRYKKGEIDLITLTNGGANNAFTWLDFTAYYFTFASDRWQAALEIESNRMRYTSFAQDEFEAEKKVVEEELRIGLDGPWEALENEVWAAAFRQHPYHWPTVGWIVDLEAASAADMKAYYDKWYHPRNAAIVVVGDFDSAEAIARINQLFGAVPTGPEAKPLHIVEPPQRGEKRVIVKKATPIERLLIGYHAPAVADADAYALHVAETVLSTGKSSRLYQRLVEKDQSVTAAKATYDDHIDPSLFCVQAELKPGFKLKDVERAIDEEIEKLGNEGLAPAEIDKAKRLIEAELVLSSEEPLQQAILLGQYETIAAGNHIPEDSRGYKYLDTVLDRINTVDSARLASVVKKYLNADNRTVGYLIDDHSGSGGGSQDRQLEKHWPSLRFDAGQPRSGTPQPPDVRIGQRVAFRTRGKREESAGAVESPPLVSPALPADGAQVGFVNREEKVRPKLDVERAELSNGMVILLSANHSNPSVSISGVVRAGSRFEPDEKAGLASLVGELIDEGTESRTSRQLAELIESVGGRLSTFGDYQASGVQASFLSKDMTLGIDVTADILINPIFPEDKVKQHVERRIAQIKSRLDVPRILASDVFNETIFKEHPQHRPPTGYEQTVRGLTRQDVLEFYQRYYVPNNAILAISGDIDKLVVRKSLEDAFGVWPRATGLQPAEPPPPVKQTRAIEKFVTVDKEQVNIFIGHIGIDRRNPDYYALLVLDTILGSSPGFTSRIPRILRDEQGLAYTTFSNVTGSAGVDPGRFAAYIGTSPENLDKALAGIRREISRIVKEPVSAQELKGAKAYLTGSFVFDFQTNAQIVQFLIDAEVYGLGFNYLETYPETIGTVTVEDVSRVARKYIDPERLTTVVVGPVDLSGKPIRKSE